MAGNIKPDNKGAAPASKEASHEDLIKQIIEEHKDIKKLLDRLSDIALHTYTTPRKSIEYYTSGTRTITNAIPNPPAGTTLSPELGYNRETVYDSLIPHRVAPRITVINDSTDTITDKTIYAISTSDGNNWSPETPILIGEAQAFFNVWELRLRSPTAGIPYRITEHDIWLPYSRPIAPGTVNKASFTAQNVAVPFPAGALIPVNIPVPDGFSLVIRANILNANAVYVAGPSPGGNAVVNVGVAATRITLNPGDSVRLYVTNANLAAILDSVAAGVDTVDLIVEQ